DRGPRLRLPADHRHGRFPQTAGHGRGGGGGRRGDGHAGAAARGARVPRRGGPPRIRVSIVDVLENAGCFLLPNTAGCFTARDAVATAQLAREAFETDWVRLGLTGHDKTPRPDPSELLVAAEQLVADGFTVLPYTSDDPILARRLADAGRAAGQAPGVPIGR